MKLGETPSEAARPRQPTVRDQKDARLLRALAAAHTLFGRHETASGFLALAAWIEPASRRTQEISALVDMRCGRSEQAMATANGLISAGCRLDPVLDAMLNREVLDGKGPQSG